MKKMDVIEEVKKIAQQYDTKMTLRQIFYRLVSKLFIPNTVSSYKRLSRILVDGRLEGLIDFDFMEDRTRRPIGGDGKYEDHENYHDSWRDSYENCYSYYRLPRWMDQPKYVEVWVEKEALASLFENITRKQNVLLSTCRGYPSLTFLHEATERLKEIKKEIHILYFGDFDPSGLDIYRHIQETFDKFQIKAVFEKISLTKEQIEKYDLPPMPAKKSDSRTKSFIEEHGDISVELDALEPDVLESKIFHSIRDNFNSEIHSKVMEDQKRKRKEIKQMIGRY